MFQPIILVFLEALLCAAHLQTLRHKVVIKLFDLIISLYGFGNVFTTMIFVH